MSSKARNDALTQGYPPCAGTVGQSHRMWGHTTCGRKGLSPSAHLFWRSFQVLRSGPWTRAKVQQIDDGALGLGEAHELDSDSHDSIRTGLCISHLTGDGYVDGRTRRKPHGDTTPHQIGWVAKVHAETESREVEHSTVPPQVGGFALNVASANPDNGVALCPSAIQIWLRIAHWPNLLGPLSQFARVGRLAGNSGLGPPSGVTLPSLVGGLWRTTMDWSECGWHRPTADVE